MLIKKLWDRRDSNPPKAPLYPNRGQISPFALCFCTKFWLFLNRVLFGLSAFLSSTPPYVLDITERHRRPGLDSFTVFDHHVITLLHDHTPYYIFANVGYSTPQGGVKFGTLYGRIKFPLQGHLGLNVPRT